MSDFSSMDTSNYTNALNDYFTAQSAGQEAYANAKQAADAKVAKFNEILDTPLQTVGSVAVTKGIAKLLPRVKAGMDTAVRKIGTKVGEKVNEAGDALKNQLNKLRGAGQESEDFGEAIEPDGIELDDLTNLSNSAETSLPPTNNIETTDIDATNSDSLDAADPADVSPPTVDQFDPSLLPEGAGGRVPSAGDSVQSGNASPGTDAADSNTQSASNVGDSQNADTLASDGADAAADTGNASAGAGAEVGADAGADVGATTTADVAAGAGADVALDTAGAAAAAEGGLNPLADLAVLGIGLGMIFGGIFGKKHAHTPPPPTPINPSFQAGAV